MRIWAALLAVAVIDGGGGEEEDVYHNQVRYIDAVTQSKIL